MTTKLNPDGPKLELDGEEQTGDKLSDSSWEGLDDKPDQTQKNLGKIARAQKKPVRTEG
jgi:hypothetical protein